MGVPTHSHLTQADASENTLTNNVAGVHERDSGNIALHEDPVPGKLIDSNINLRLVVDSGNSIAHQPLKAQPDSQDIQMAEGKIDEGCADPQVDSKQDVPPAVSAEVPLSELQVFSVDGPTASMNIDYLEVHIHAPGQRLSPPKTVSSSVVYEGNEGEVDFDGARNINTKHTVSDHVHGANFAPATDEEEIPHGRDHHENFPSSPLPSSSPPQIFSSSPCASSQFSASGAETSNMVRMLVEGSTDPREYPHTGDVAQASQDEFRESERLFPEKADLATLPEADKYRSEIVPASRAEDDPGRRRKRVADQMEVDESCEQRSTKRSTLDSHVCLPPTPVRATLASQNRQFKKLAAPFRPPTKLPVSTDEFAETIHNRASESDTGFTGAPKMDHDKPDAREPTPHVSPSRLQHKASNTSRSAAQFKSPLVNRTLPADSRTIRLTPGLQALQRKLQLLKRAIKVKEENEEEVLTRLTRKWIEAGREVAYDVWDATKDAGGFGGKATFARRAGGWGSSADGNRSWGWDTNVGDANEEFRDLNSSVPCEAGRLTPEDDDAGFNNTLGTMLRQLGIAPEIFGWDDEKEVFSD